jgi:hypothetical protein
MLEMWPAPGSSTYFDAGSSSFMARITAVLLPSFSPQM